MLINLWYVVEWSDKVKDKPVKSRVLGQDVVLFRDKAGKIHCLNNVCIHRGGSLAGGWCTDGNVTCPYHGWQFDPSGQCVKVPSEGDDFRISDRFQIESYPAVEKYGMIWAFMGDLPEEERPSIPDFPEYDDDSLRRLRTETTWETEVARVVENGIDLAHASFVHPSFGTPETAAANTLLEMETGEWEGWSKNVQYPPATTGIQKGARKEKAPTYTYPRWALNGMVVHIRIDINENWTTTMFDANTPIDEHTTRTFAWQTRTFLKNPIFDGNSLKRLKKIFEQDRVIIEAASPYYLPEHLTNEVSVGDDKFMSSFRAARRKYIEKGNLIDSFEVARHMGRKVFAVPSPNRRAAEDKGKRWVFEKMPLVEGSEALRAAE